jgi:hypothetical protein
MKGAPKRTRYFLDIEPEIRNGVKAVTALRSKTMKYWLKEAIIAKLEDELGASEGLLALNDTEGTLSLETYLDIRKRKLSKSR